MDSTEKLSRRVQIELFWGDTPLDVIQVPERRGTILAGSEYTSAVPLPDVLPYDRFPLLDIDAGDVTVRAGGNTRFYRNQDGAWVRLDTVPDPDRPGTIMAMLPENSPVRLDFERLNIVLSRQRVRPPRRGFLASELEPAFLNSLLLVVFGAAAFVATLLLGPQARGSAEVELHKASSRYFYNLVSHIESDRKRLALDLFKSDLSTTKTLADLPAGPAGKAGKPGAPDTGKRSAHKAIKPDDRESVSHLGLVAALTDAPGLAGTFDTTHHGLGGDLSSAIGGLEGKTPGTSGGYGGLDVAGSGPGGHGTNTNVLHGSGPVSRPELDNSSRPKVVYSSPTENVPLISHGEPHFRGSLPAEIIRQYIRKHRQQIRYCYERELTRHPNLAGKLRVHFVINHRGHVSTAEASQSSSLAAGNLRSCVLARVRGWRFPRPTGGGEVDVTYPFLFAPSGRN
jgi:hypothetical protein